MRVSEPGYKNCGRWAVISRTAGLDEVVGDGNYLYRVQEHHSVLLTYKAAEA